MSLLSIQSVNIADAAAIGVISVVIGLAFQIPSLVCVGAITWLFSVIGLVILNGAQSKQRLLGSSKSRSF